MKRLFTRFLILACLAALVGCAATPSDTIVQVGAIGPLVAGGYDGFVTCGQVKSHGTMGLGTFDRLDGEMVVLDGTVYQVAMDGSVRPMPDAVTVPFATVAGFSPDTAFGVHDTTTRGDLEQMIDKAASDTGVPVAVMCTGRFSRMTTRSVPAQDKPYPPLTDVVRHQAVFDFEDIQGTVVGFRCPESLKSATVFGYHLHFLSADRQRGGHVLDFALAEGEVALDICPRFLLILPEKAGTRAQTASQQDLDAVEGMPE